MISLIIKDGLGNQLFQYAFARYLQKLYSDQGQNEEIVINPLYMNSCDFRKISLQHFRLNDNVRFMEGKEQKIDLIDFKLRVLYANGLDMIPWKITKTGKPIGKEKFLKRVKHGVYYTYQSQTGYGAPLAKTTKKYIFGCYQGEENFKPIKEIIKSEFQIITPMRLVSIPIMNKILDTESVCLHIRRGDYLDVRWKNLQVCDYNYYNDAINELLKQVDNPVFFLFSNSHEDLDWIKKNYRFNNRIDNRELQFYYVDLQNPDYEELRLMMSCKHFIISNSTFSWWAAYLAKNTNKKVFVPERWNLASEDDSSIYLDYWNKIRLKKG